ncbi:MAG TPA: hypothetical protein VJV78_40600 [Polyangiales bacterium]|nr:hypothetical protein [Polyangiales bacterium]
MAGIWKDLPGGARQDAPPAFRVRVERQDAIFVTPHELDRTVRCVERLWHGFREHRLDQVVVRFASTHAFDEQLGLLGRQALGMSNHVAEEQGSPARRPDEPQRDRARRRQQPPALRKLPRERFVRAASELPPAAGRERHHRTRSTATRKLDAQPTSERVPHHVRAVYSQAIELRLNDVERRRNAMTVRGRQRIATVVSRHGQRD